MPTSRATVRSGSGSQPWPRVRNTWELGKNTNYQAPDETNGEKLGPERWPFARFSG